VNMREEARIEIFLLEIIIVHYLPMLSDSLVKVGLQNKETGFGLVNPFLPVTVH